MMFENLARIDRIEEIVVDLPEQDHQDLVELIFDAVKMTLFLDYKQLMTPQIELHSNQKAFNMAALSALQTVNSLLSAANTSCRKVNPPSDIEMVTDSSGKLIYRCYHKPDHKWDLNGNPIP